MLINMFDVYLFDDSIWLDDVFMVQSTLNFPVTQVCYTNK